MKIAAIKQLLRDSEAAGLSPEQIDSLLDTLQMYKNIIDDLYNN